MFNDTVQEFAAALQLMEKARENVYTMKRQKTLSRNQEEILNDGAKMLVGRAAAIESLLHEVWGLGINIKDAMPKVLLGTDH